MVGLCGGVRAAGMHDLDRDKWQASTMDEDQGFTAVMHYSCGSDLA